MKCLTVLLSCFFTVVASAQAPTEAASITVDASRSEGHVSSRMYAAFVEMMAEDVKWGLTSEMLHDRSFEEETNYLGLPAAWQHEPDDRNDDGGAIKFSVSSQEAYPVINRATGAPEHSLSIMVGGGDVVDLRKGFSQGRLSVQSGQTYQGYFWAKLPEKDAYTGSITVAIEQDVTDGLSYAQATLSGLGGDWHRYAFTLTSTKTDRFAKLSFLFAGSGSLFLDQVSLQPAKAHSQVRADSEALINGLHPSFLRWPGGNVAQDYHWEWGIGPRDLRPTWINKAWGNAPEPGDLGTDEYLALCGRLHIEPSITVNVDGSGATPDEAAAWVEYVNGPPSSKYGAIRAANGHLQPYNVKQWELGNEIFGDWVRGHTTAKEYAAAAVRYATAMRAVDPTIKLIAVGEGKMVGSDEWNSTVLTTAGPDIQYLAVHDYTSLSQSATEADPHVAIMRRPSEFEANYRHVSDLIRQSVPGHNIKLIVNEWNLFEGASVQGMEGAIYASRMMNGFERNGEIIDANCISDLLNGWIGGVIQSSRDRIYGTAQYYAVKMYADHLGTERLYTVTNSPELERGVPTIDAVSTRSVDGSEIFIKLSNADRIRAVSTTIKVNNVRLRPRIEAEVLKAVPKGARNTFERPDNLTPTTKRLDCLRKCTVTIAPQSVMILTFYAGS